jgi:Fe-S cluster assembly protein SufD
MYINIPKSKVADRPIEIMYFSTGNEAALLVQPRNLIGRRKCTRSNYRRHQSLNENPVLTNSVTDFCQKRAMLIL